MTDTLLATISYALLHAVLFGCLLLNIYVQYNPRYSRCPISGLHDIIDLPQACSISQATEVHTMLLHIANNSQYVQTFQEFYFCIACYIVGSIVLCATAFYAHESSPDDMPRKPVLSQNDTYRNLLKKHLEDYRRDVLENEKQTNEQLNRAIDKMLIMRDIHTFCRFY